MRLPLPAPAPTAMQPSRHVRQRLRHIHALDDFEPAARAHLPRPLFHYICEAVEQRLTLADNRTAFEELAFVPPTLTDVTQRHARTTLFGHTYAQPFGIAPMGAVALMAYRGDLALAAAAAQANIPMVLSGASLIPMEAVAAAYPGAWFQAYVPGSEAAIEQLVQRVERAGFGALVLTVDTRIPSNRANMARAGFTLPMRPSASLAWQGLSHPRWLLGTFLRTLLKHGLPHFENTYVNRGAPILSPDAVNDMGVPGTLSWDHVRLMRRLWRKPLLLKGILAADDARRAVDMGVDGLVLSNHGGRQLDGAVSPLRVLPAVRQAVGRGPVVALDGGVRRGSDIIKAVALGADAVFVGRPYYYASAVAGEAGARHATALLAHEVLTTMGLLNLNRLDEAGPHLLLRVGGVPQQHGMPL